MSTKDAKEMNEAANKENVKSAEELEAERRRAIGEFNVTNMGKMWIDADRIPTDDDIAQAKKDYEDHIKELQDRDDYVVADKTNALRVAKFLKRYNETCFWGRLYFRGVLKFNDFITDFIDNFDENNPVDLVLPYAPLQYLDIAFENFAGIGIESARVMNDMWEEFEAIGNKIRELMEWYEEHSRIVTEYQQRWAMMSQGFYAVITSAHGEDAEVDETASVEHENTSAAEKM